MSHKVWGALVGVSLVAALTLAPLSSARADETLVTSTTENPPASVSTPSASVIVPETVGVKAASVASTPAAPKPASTTTVPVVVPSSATPVASSATPQTVKVKAAVVVVSPLLVTVPLPSSLASAKMTGTCDVPVLEVTPAQIEGVSWAGAYLLSGATWSGGKLHLPRFASGSIVGAALPGYALGAGDWSARFVGAIEQTCGDQPAGAITASTWTDTTTHSCVVGSETVTQTRTVTTTVYVSDLVNWEWVPSTTTTTEIQTRPMTSAEIAQLCAVSVADADHDGVADSVDKCPGTAVGASVDANGCSAFIHRTIWWRMPTTGILPQWLIDGLATLRCGEKAQVDDYYGPPELINQIISDGVLSDINGNGQYEDGYVLYPVGGTISPGYNGGWYAYAPKCTIIDVPAAPSVTDLCGVGNAKWNVPAKTDTLSWKVDDKGHLIVTIVPANTTFADKTTSHDFGIAPETNTEVCITVVDLPAQPAVSDKCGVANWIVPANTDTFAWAVNDKNHLVVTVVPAHTTLPGGATSHDFGIVPKSNTDTCVTDNTGSTPVIPNLGGPSLQQVLPAGITGVLFLLLGGGMVFVARRLRKGMPA